MQRKSNVSSQTLVADMHFAVVPYEIEFLVPKDEVYQIYFEKGLQILGTTRYPNQNNVLTKKVQLPIASNIMSFRLFSERNSQYQWSIYKRVDGMQEFLETKKINLKDIMKKQPQKRIENQKRALERKQSMISRKNQGKPTSELKNASKTSELKAVEQKTNEVKMVDQSLIQRFSEMSSEGRGCIYDEQIKSDLGQFVLRFYVFKAYSSLDLSRAIEQKCRQKKQERRFLQEINIAKVAALPRISEISATVEEQVPVQTVEQASEQHQLQTRCPVVQQVQQTAQKVVVGGFYQQGVEMTAEEKIEGYVQFVQEREVPEVEIISQKIVQDTPVVQAENLVQEGQVGAQINQMGPQQDNAQPLVVAVKTPARFPLMVKKMFILGLILLIISYTLYSFNIFQKLGFSEPKQAPKRGKKERLSSSNRKKTVR